MKSITYETYQEKILRVHLKIREVLAAGQEVPSLEILAETANLSPFHFHRVFKGLTGESLAEHIRRLRLEFAASQLKFGDKGITMIAMDAGYESHEAFTRAFYRCFGEAPSVYRETRGNFFRKGTMMNVSIKKISARKVLFVRHTGPYAQCGKAWETLCGWAGKNRMIGMGTKFLGLSYDDPDVTSADKIRYDACLTVNKDVAPQHPVAFQEIPAGEYACYIHEGPLEKLHATYLKLSGEWLPRSGRTLKALPSVEVYLNDPERTPPEKLKVEIQLPLE